MEGTVKKTGRLVSRGLGVCCVVVASLNADLYVSPTGSGSDFSQQRPGPISGVQDKIRTAKNSESGDLIVHFAVGTYFINQTMDLSAQDGGANGNRVVWEGDAWGKVLISGGQLITGWTMHDAGKGIWKAALPAGFDSRQFYVDGKRAIRARAPEDDNFNSIDHVWPPQYANMDKNGFTTTYNISSWKNIRRIEANMRMNWWRHARVPLESASGNYCSFQQPGGQYASRQGMGNVLYIENAYELLDAEDEWYIDPTVNTIYYKPLAGKNMNTATAIAGKLERLININGARGIVFRNLRFAHSTWMFPNSNFGYTTWQGGYYYSPKGGWDGETQMPGAVQIEQSSDITFETCILEHVGSSAFTITNGANTVSVIGCRVEDISGHGFEIGSGLSGAMTRAVTVKNNYIHECAVEFQDNHGLFIPVAKNIHFTNNEMHGFDYSAIAVGWGWTGTDDADRGDLFINRNYVWDYLRKGSDGGGAYLMSSQLGSAFNENYIRKNNDPGRKHSGTGYMHGGSIYVEDGGSWFSIQRNVCTETSRWLFTWATSSHDNDIQYNWSDTHSEQLTIAGQVGNVIANNNYFTGAIPAGAQVVVDNAGIEDVYQYIKNGDATVNVAAPFDAAVGIKVAGACGKAGIEFYRVSGRRIGVASGSRSVVQQAHALGLQGVILWRTAGQMSGPKGRFALPK